MRNAVGPIVVLAISFCIALLGMVLDMWQARMIEIDCASYDAKTGDFHYHDTCNGISVNWGK